MSDLAESSKVERIKQLSSDYEQKKQSRFPPPSQARQSLLSPLPLASLPRGTIMKERLGQLKHR